MPSGGDRNSQLRPEDFARLEKLLDPMSSAGDSTNILGSPSVRSCRMALVGMARRPRLALEIARLHVALEPYLRLWFVHAGTPSDARAEHEQLLRGLRLGTRNIRTRWASTFSRPAAANRHLLEFIHRATRRRPGSFGWENEFADLARQHDQQKLRLGTCQMTLTLAAVPVTGT